MNLIKLLALLALSSSLSACGGSSSSTEGSAQEGTSEQSAGGESGGEHPHMAPVLTALHDVLAPTWHSEPGATRAGLACTNAARLEEESRNVAAGPAPEHADPAMWAAGTTQLTTTVAALVSECGASGPAVEERLSTFHDAFHALMDMSH